MKAISLFFILSACATQDPNYHPIASPLEAKQDEFRSCYLESESYQGRNKVEKGEVSVAFTINPIGKVINAKIANSQFKDPNFHACLLDQVRRIEFSPSKDGKEIATVQPINIYPTYK